MHQLPQKGRRDGLDIFRLPIALIACLSLWGCHAATSAGGPNAVEVIGLVSETDDRRCHKDHRTTRVNQRPTVAGASVTPHSVSVDEWQNRVVLAEVTPMPHHVWPAIQHTGRCPPLQLRSDMDERGRIIRGPGLPFSSLRVHRIQHFPGWQVSTAGDHLTVTFENDTQAVLKNMRITVFYEGCFGKPGSWAEPIAIGTLRPGDLYRERIPKHRLEERNDGRSGREYVAHTLRLTGFNDTRFVLIEEVVYDNKKLGVNCNNGVHR